MIDYEHCNYCRILLARTKARGKGWKITRLRTKRGPEGITVYIHPKKVDVKKLKNSARASYYVVFCSAIPEFCCCV